MYFYLCLVIVNSKKVLGSARRDYGVSSGQHGRYATHIDSEPVVKEAAATAPQAPLTVDGSDAYDDAPAIPAAVPAAAVTAASPAVTGSVAPVASSVEKDFSGFGDAADDFEIDDLD